jgi:hypothetical protein
VIFCLGHTSSAQGMFGPPRDLVCQSVERVYRATRELRPAQPVKHPEVWAAWRGGLPVIVNTAPA